MSAPAPKKEFKRYNFTDDFIRDVNEYVSYDAKIAEVNAALDIIKQKQKTKYNAIIDYMRLNDIPACPLSDGKAIYHVVTKNRPGVSKSLVYERLKQFYSSSPDALDRIIKFVEDPSVRAPVEKEKLIVK